MEKTIQIGDKAVRFKSTAATPIRYKAQFGTDYFGDIFKLGKLSSLSKSKNKEVDFDKLENFDSQVFYQIVWVLAKTADKETPELLDWLDQFEELPIFDVFTELQDLIITSMKSKKK